jgi:hypothetical protein
MKGGLLLCDFCTAAVVESMISRMMNAESEDCRSEINGKEEVECGCWVGVAGGG